MEQIQTVGDLQRLLSRFNPELPILKSNLVTKAYFPIPDGGKFEYRVKVIEVTGPPYGATQDAFIDADVNDAGSFNAIIL